ncbi:MAG: hypothetical protein ABII76_12900 [Pseudomonadota bacterium]
MAKLNTSAGAVETKPAVEPETQTPAIEPGEGDQRLGGEPEEKPGQDPDELFGKPTRQTRGMVERTPDGRIKTDKRKLTEAEIDRVTNNTATALAAQPKVTIRLHQNSKQEKQLSDETVQINGHTYLIKRGVSVEVPEEVVLVLERAGKL